MDESRSGPVNVPVHRDTAWLCYIDRVAAGDPDALACLYDETSALVYSIVLRILGNPADAEEVTLDVYSQVWRTSATFDQHRASIGSWLVLLARSRAIDRLRSRSRNPANDRIELTPDLLGPGLDPEQISASNEQAARVRNALLALAPEQRDLLELAFYSGLTQSELAARLSVPLGTVKTRMRLGMMRLKQMLRGTAETP